MADQNTRPTPSSDVAELIGTLRGTAKYVRDEKFLTGAARLMEKAAIALSRLSPPAQVEVTDEMAMAASTAFGNAFGQDIEGETLGELRLRAGRAALTAALTATDAKPVEAYQRYLDSPNNVSPSFPLSFEDWKAATDAKPLDEHKWLDPECGTNGCQSLVWKSRYEAAVNGRREFRQAYRELRAATDANPVVPAEPVAGDDADLLDALRENSWDLRCFSVPTGGDDADIGWRVIGHWQAASNERTVAEVFHDEPRDAIRAALASEGKSRG